MKITILTPHINICGGVRVLLGYADGLAKKGHKVTVICPQQTFGIRKFMNIRIKYPKRLAQNFRKHKPEWMSVSADIKYVPSYAEKYIPNSDIVVATAWQTAPYVADYSIKKGKKFYLFMHYERLFDDGCDDVDRFTFNLPLTKIVISSCIKQTLKNRFGQDSILINNPVDLDIFYPTRKEYNKRFMRICMLHHVEKWKGIEDGTEAFKIARQQYKDIRLVMFGCESIRNMYDCEYHFKPSSDKLREIYNSCDIFLCPSWREGFGLPGAEAMACKCALVTADNGGCRDYAIHEKTALISEPKSPKKLATCLMKLIANPRLLTTIAENGYEHIKSFSWERAIKEIEQEFIK